MKVVMREYVRWIGYSLGIALLLAAAVWALSRLRGPSAEQAAALALMERPWNPQGRNAFADLWLLQYDVPEAERAGVMAEDVTRFERRPAPSFGTFVSVAAERYRDLTPDEADRELLCSVPSAGCLAKVRGDPDAYAALVDRNAALLKQTEALSGDAFVGSPFRPSVAAPFPPYPLASIPLTAHALAFVRGDVDAALAGACRGIATWRDLGSRSDSLIARMVGIRNSTDGYGRLLAEFLAELPPEHALPGACAVALAPMQAGEITLCSSMQGEFRTESANIGAMTTDAVAQGNRLENLTRPLGWNAAMSRAAAAEAYAPACTDAGLARVRADVPLSAPEGRSLLRLECASNLVGCLLFDVARPGYSVYFQRAQDQAAQIQLLATLAWLREQPTEGRTLAQRLSARPQALVSPTRDVEVGDGGSTIRIRQFDDSRGAYWSIPLPAELQDRTP